MSRSDSSSQGVKDVEKAQLEFEAAARSLVEANRAARAQGRQITDEMQAAIQRVNAAQDRLKRAELDLALDPRAFEPIELTPLVVTKVNQSFSPEERTYALEILVNECGRNLPFCKDATGQDLERIRLAVIKLASGNFDELRRKIETAKRDWRDVLTLAENPEAARMGLVEFAQLEEKSRGEFETRDQEQYFNWLHGGHETKG